MTHFPTPQGVEHELPRMKYGENEGQFENLTLEYIEYSLFKIEISRIYKKKNLYQLLIFQKTLSFNSTIDLSSVLSSRYGLLNIIDDRFFGLLPYDQYLFCQILLFSTT